MSLWECMRSRRGHLPEPGPAGGPAGWASQRRCSLRHADQGLLRCVPIALPHIAALRSMRLCAPRAADLQPDEEAAQGAELRQHRRGMVSYVFGESLVRAVEPGWCRRRLLHAHAGLHCSKINGAPCRRAWQPLQALRRHTGAAAAPLCAGPLRG